MEPDRAPIVSIRGVTKSFGPNQVLKGVDLNVRRGEVVAIIGPSGSGKTTLLRCINFLEEYDGGSITVDGVEAGYRDGPEARNRRRRSERELSRLRADTAMVFQMFNLFPHLTAAENVMLGLRKVRGQPKAQAREIAHRWLARVGLADKVDFLPSQLSGGQQQRVGIARAVAMDPKVLLLDEVTSALDPELVGEVLDVVIELAEEGRTMILVTHEMAFAREVASRVVFIDAGQIQAEGAPADIFDRQPNERLKAFLARFVAFHRSARARHEAQTRQETT
ncbi:amino acid ABC transporter ATP-binding protein [Microvirga massiliensis]|uniref:amino acid ABC transporter ATP-binding protein n=1 Tax=Microvirga massiliensis TaxID=1033741 RepID=UPI00062BCA37|nr:amino acid ABC transporter ATP-binding protein [Microvirga massiliensis]